MTPHHPIVTLFPLRCHLFGFFVTSFFSEDTERIYGDYKGPDDLHKAAPEDGLLA